MMNSSHLRLRWTALLLSILPWMWASPAGARQTPTRQTPRPTPRPIRGGVGPGAPNIMDNIPYEIDPRAPGLSREEMIRRQQELLREIGRRRTAPRATPSPARAERARTIREAGETAPPGAVGEPISIKLDTGPDLLKNLDADPKGRYQPMTLYLTPGSKSLAPGESFATEVHLLNQYRDYTDRVSIVIKYPPEYLEPVSMHEDGVAGLLSGPADWGIDAAGGEIRYEARFEIPLRIFDMRILDVVWRAVKPGDDVRLTLWSGGADSGAYLGDELLTLNEFGPRGSLSGAMVRIVEARGPMPAGERIVRDPFVDYAPVLVDIARTQFSPIGLSIRYPQGPIHEPGEWVVFDVHLENPDRITFDELSVSLRFDPAVILFSDADHRNLIHFGSNVLDGPFRERWNWDTHLDNRIDNVAGTIEYRVRNNGLLPRGDGIVFRAVGQVRRRTAGPLIQWNFRPSPAPGEVTTAVNLFGSGLLAKVDGERLAPGADAFGRGELGGVAPGLLAERADPSLYRTRAATLDDIFNPQLYRRIIKK